MSRQLSKCMQMQSSVMEDACTVVSDLQIANRHLVYLTAMANTLQSPEKHVQLCQVTVLD